MILTLCYQALKTVKDHQDASDMLVIVHLNRAACYVSEEGRTSVERGRDRRRVGNKGMGMERRRGGEDFYLFLVLQRQLARGDFDYRNVITECDAALNIKASCVKALFRRGQVVLCLPTSSSSPCSFHPAPGPSFHLILMLLAFTSLRWCHVTSRCRRT